MNPTFYLKKVKNIYINISNRNCLVNITDINKNTEFKASLGNLNVEKAERKNKLSYYKLGLYCGYIFLTKNISIINIFLKSWNRVYKRFIKGLQRYNLLILKTEHYKYIAHNGTKIRHERRR